MCARVCQVRHRSISGLARERPSDMLAFGNTLMSCSWTPSSGSDHVNEHASMHRQPLSIMTTSLNIDTATAHDHVVPARLALSARVSTMRTSASAYGWEPVDTLDTSWPLRTPDSPWQRFPSMLLRARRGQPTTSAQARCSTVGTDSSTCSHARVHTQQRHQQVSRSVSCYEMASKSSPRPVVTQLAPLAQLRVGAHSSHPYLCFSVYILT